MARGTKAQSEAVMGRVSAQELRRDYVRAVRSNKPASDAEAFRRVHDAYEQARAQAQESRDDAELLVQRAEQPGRADAAIPASHEERKSTLFHALAAGELTYVGRLLDSLHQEGALRWEALQSDEPERAAWLFAHHIDRELLAGRGEALRSLVTSEAFMREASRVPELKSLGYRVLAFTCQQDATPALEFLRRAPPVEHVIDANLVLLERTLSGGSMADAPGALADSPALSRALLLGMLEPKPGQLAQAALDELGDHKQALLRFDALKESSPATLTRVLRVLDAWAPVDERTWAELSAAERIWLSSMVKEVDKSLDRDFLNTFATHLLWPLLALVIWAFIKLGIGYAFLVLIACFVVYLIIVSLNDRSLYRRVLRGQLITRLVDKGMSTDMITECLAHQPKFTSDVGRLFAEMDADVALDVLSALMRVRLLRERNPEPERAYRPLGGKPAGRRARRARRVFASESVESDDGIFSTDHDS